MKPGVLGGGDLEATATIYTQFAPWFPYTFSGAPLAEPQWSPNHWGGELGLEIIRPLLKLAPETGCKGGVVAGFAAMTSSSD